MFHYTVFGLVFPAPDKMPRISRNAKSVLSTIRECWLGFVNSCRMGLVKLQSFSNLRGRDQPCLHAGQSVQRPPGSRNAQPCTLRGQHMLPPREQACCTLDLTPCEPFTNLIALFRQLQEPLNQTPDLRRQLESTPPHDFVGNRKVVHVALSILILTVH